MSTKQNDKHAKRQRIAKLERQLAESLVGQAHVYKLAMEAMGKVTTEHLASSGARGEAGCSHHGLQAIDRNAADSVSSARAREGTLSA